MRKKEALLSSLGLRHGRHTMERTCGFLLYRLSKLHLRTTWPSSRRASLVHILLRAGKSSIRLATILKLMGLASSYYREHT